jgi:DNA-binding response OmpR family regulator
MAGFPPAREDDEARLTDARGEFVTSLPRRLEVLRAGLVQLAEAPADRERLNGMLRRLHALASSARVLGFASVAEVLGEAERTLHKTPRAGTPGVTLKEVGRALDLLPSLVLGTAAAQQDGQLVDSPVGIRSAPIGILVFGPQTLASAFAAEAGEHFELERTQDAARFSELARTAAPDAIVVDLDEGGAKELLEALRADPLVERSPVIGVGSFATADAAAVFAAAGADRVLSKPVSPEILRRTLLELGELAARSRTDREPLGDLSVEELAERIALEVKKGLVESLESGSHARVQFGDGADVLGAVWGAVARVRELVTLRSAGNLRFQPYGPEGAIPLAPWVNDDRRAGERGVPSPRSADEVALKGRRVVIADDDPAVVWFLSGLLKAVGAEVLEAHDGERALQRVFESWPDLVVSDVLMPRRDGFSLCHEIKRDVIVRDVPVILLSWKEDLLQRVRELGATADGYLRKEATASTVVERVREVLRPRARIEQRLRSGGEVRGRLDGVTPRLVLELVSKCCPDATLTIRDAVYLYEAHLRGGRLRSITRSATDGSFERGSAVLSALLGVSAGRFVVQPDTTPCRSEFDAPLPELFAEPVRRARAALAALAAERLPRVVKVELALEGMGRYLECTPHSARQLVKRLAAGESPRDLLMSGEASAWLLEAVLSDLARRGAIGDVEAEEPRISEAARARAAAAEEVEPTPVEALRTSQSPPERAPSRGDSGWSEPPEPPHVSGAAATRASSDAVSDALSPAPLRTETSPAASPQSTSLDAASEPPAAEPGWFSFQLETDPRAVPPVAQGAGSARPPSTSALATASSASKIVKAPSDDDDDTDAVFAALADAEPALPPRSAAAVVTAPPASAAVPVPTPAGRREPTLLGLGTSNASPEDEDRPDARVGVRPVLRMPRSSEPPSPSMADVFAAALASERDPSQSEPQLAISGPQPRRVLEPVDPSLHLAPTPALSGVAPVSGTAADAEPSKSAAAEAAPALPLPPEITRTLASGLDRAAEDAVAAVGSEPAAAQEAAISIPIVSASFVEDSASLPEPSPAIAALPSVPSTDESKASPLASSTLVSERDPVPTSAAPRSPAARSEVKKVGAAAKAPSAAAPRPAEPTPTPSPVEAPVSRAAVVRTVLLAGAAAAAGFFVVSQIVVPWLAPAEVVEPTPAPSAIIAAAREPVAPSGPKIVIEPVDLPPGVDPGSGRGLLDVMGEASDQLYVDGTFVGRGPGRSVPTSAGSHEVKIVRGEMAYSTQVELSAAKRLRVRLGPRPAPRPSP